MCVVRTSSGIVSKAVVILKDGRRLESEEFMDDLNYRDSEAGYTVKSTAVLDGLLESEGISRDDAGKVLIIRDMEEDDTVYVSDHAEKRIMEREGIGRKSIARIVKKAWECGTDGATAPGLTGKWVRGRDQANRKYVLYGDFLYIFDSARNVLITVIHVPSRANILRSADHRDNKRSALRDNERHKKYRRDGRKASYGFRYITAGRNGKNGTTQGIRNASGVIRKSQ